MNGNGEILKQLNKFHVHTDENTEYLTQILQDAMKTRERKYMTPQNNKMQQIPADQQCELLIQSIRNVK